MRNETRYELTPDNYFTVQVTPNGVSGQAIVKVIFNQRGQHYVDTIYTGFERSNMSVYVKSYTDNDFEKSFDIDIEGYTISHRICQVLVDKETEYWLILPTQHIFGCQV